MKFKVLDNFIFVLMFFICQQDKLRVPVIEGLGFANGARFREQRRWAIHTLSSFGFGRNLMEKAILEELIDLRAKIEANIQKDSGAVTDIHLPISESVANVLSAIVFGERLGGDPEFERMRSQIDTFMNTITSKFVPIFFAPYVPVMPLIQF